MGGDKLANITGGHHPVCKRCKRICLPGIGHLFFSQVSFCRSPIVWIINLFFSWGFLLHDVGFEKRPMCNDFDQCMCVCPEMGYESYFDLHFAHDVDWFSGHWDQSIAPSWGIAGQQLLEQLKIRCRWVHGVVPLRWVKLSERRYPGYSSYGTRHEHCICFKHHFNYHTMWGPPVISWFISPSNYSYKYHKP
jgi:hypothetical protein